MSESFIAGSLSSEERARFDADNRINISISQEEYEKYRKSGDTIKNERISPPDVHFLDFIMSPEADFTKTPEGKHFLEVLKAL